MVDYLEMLTSLEYALSYFPWTKFEKKSQISPVKISQFAWKH